MNKIIVESLRKKNWQPIPWYEFPLRIACVYVPSWLFARMIEIGTLYALIPAAIAILGMIAYNHLVNKTKN